MKNFKSFLREQILKQDQNTLDPDFEEKKDKSDQKKISKIEKEIKQVDSDINK
jgi:hypothetical protein